MPVCSQPASYANTKLTIVSNSRSSSSNSRERSNERRYCIPTTKGKKNSRHLIFGCIKKKWRCNICSFLSAWIPSNGHGEATAALLNIMMSRAICTGSVFQFHFFFSLTLWHGLRTVKMVEINRMHWTPSKMPLI